MRWAATVLGVLVVAVIAGLAYVRATGLRANVAPGGFEARLARTTRAFAVPAADRNRPNPVPRSEDAVRDGLEHFADHCAFCHGNDGSGVSDFGQRLYPPAPDLRAAATQNMTDGELFYVIENGIRFTGMPAFATGEAHGQEDSWKLVHFIRHLPRLTPEQLGRMKELNPRSAEEIRLEIEEERFLRGEDAGP